MIQVNKYLVTTYGMKDTECEPLWKIHNVWVTGSVFKELIFSKKLTTNINSENAIRRWVLGEITSEDQKCCMGRGRLHVGIGGQVYVMEQGIPAKVKNQYWKAWWI